MKALFLAEQVNANAGLTKIRLIDVNGGEGLTDFRAGSQRGDLQVNVFGDQSLFVAGKTYVLEISEYVEAAETQEGTEAPVIETKLKAVAADDEQPVTEEFEGKITITHDGERLMIAIKPYEEEEKAAETEALNTAAKEQAKETEPAKESEANTDTHDSAAANTAGAAKEGANEADSTNNQGNHQA